MTSNGLEEPRQCDFGAPEDGGAVTIEVLLRAIDHRKQVVVAIVSISPRTLDVLQGTRSVIKEENVAFHRCLGALQVSGSSGS